MDPASMGESERMEVSTQTYSQNYPVVHLSADACIGEPRFPYVTERRGPVTTDSFEQLVAVIEETHRAFLERATKAVNLSLTVRNWLIGYYIREYEQAGEDRAAYGDQLLDLLAGRLRKSGLKRAEARELRRFRQFYLAYPQIRETLTPEFLGASARILSADLARVAIRESSMPESDGERRGSTLNGSARVLIERLSFSHFGELLQISEPLRRTFYEIEAVRGNWSVRELRRQIATQYFERCGLSREKDALSRLAHMRAEVQGAKHVIRDPYVFEFLGLEPHEIVSEGRLEDMLIDRLQEFLLELGHGFCFEARQKRLLIGDEYFFVDLVFYHRVLKCHVLVELKNDRFRHEHLGQLNSYVAWFKQNQMMAGDRSPIGILLCTEKNHELVEFALAGMPSKLFVSRYQVRLPDKREISAFLQRAIEEFRSHS